MTSSELCTCNLDRHELLERAGAGEGILALLLPLADERAQIRLPAPRTGHEVTPEKAPPPISPEMLAARFIRLRRKRDSIFERRIFADPAWDMMLDLYQASDEGARPVSVSSLCIAAAVPATTALRWIDVLVQKGLLEKQADAGDGRRTFVTLTNEATRKMREVLSFWEETA